MRREDFKDSAPGSFIRIYTEEGNSWAFVPKCLPPRLQYDDTLISLIEEASRVLGGLSEAGRRMDNPYLLIRPYLQREAVSSSRIEGTQSTLSEVFLSEISAPKGHRLADVREVTNYVKAMEHGRDNMGSLSLSIRLLRGMHRVLLQGVEAHRKAGEPGEFRKEQVYIATWGCKLTEARFVPPPHSSVADCMTDWEKYLNEETARTPLIQCGLTHYQFEAIHPFKDGNGRVGRLLMILFLLYRGVLSQPLLYLSEFFERNKDEYYSRLLAVSQKGDWEGWLKFFMRGVIEQGNDALLTTRRMSDLRSEYKERLQGAKHVPTLAYSIIDKYIFANPFISISQLARECSKPYGTVKLSVERLVKIDVLRKYVTEVNKRTYYFAWELMDVLTKPPSATRESQVQRTLGFD